MDSIGGARGPGVRAGLVLLFLAVGLLVFSVYFGGAFALEFTRRLHPGLRQQVAIVRGLQVAVALGSLTAALALRRSTRLGPYWRLAFATFAALSSLILSDYTGDWALSLSGQAVSTARGFTALKLGEDAAIIDTIVLLALLTRDDPQELFLSKGRLCLGLAIGITSFLAFTALGISRTLARGIRPGTVRELLPAFLLVVLADGFYGGVALPRAVPEKAWAFRGPSLGERSDGNGVHLRASGGSVHSIPPHVPRDRVTARPAMRLDHAENGESARSSLASRRRGRAHHCRRICRIWHRQLIGCGLHR